MTKNDWYEAGDQIKRIVQDAVDTGDFSQIGGAISDVVNDTLDGLLGNGNYRGSGRPNGQTYDSYDQTYDSYDQTNDGYGRAYDSYDQANGDAYGSGQSYKNASGAGTDDWNYGTAGQTYQSPGSGGYNTGSQTYQNSGSGSYGTGGQTYQSSGTGGYGSDGTYRGTSERIRRAYEQAESKGRQAYERATERVHRQTGNQNTQRAGTWSGQRSQTFGQWGNQNGRNRQTSSGTYQPVPARRKVPGELGSKVMKYIGFGLGVLFGASFGLAVMAAFMTGGFYLLWDSAGSVGFLCICSLLLGIRGEQRLGISRRFRRYQEVIGARTYCLIEELASGIGETTSYVKKDLKKMLRRGYFPVGYLDRKETLLITDQSTYQQYLKTEEEYEKRQSEETASEEAERAKKKKNAQSVKNTKNAQNAKDTAAGKGASGTVGAHTTAAEANSAKKGDTKGNTTSSSDAASKEEEPERSPEHQALIDEGWKYIRHIRDCNDRLPDAEITAKLNRLELVVTRIFREAEKNPDAVSDLRKMMSYYLPTTRKLLDAYCDLDNQPIRGENIENTRHEIESALDTINTAFENLLNDLFEEQAWDVSSDISVLNAMFAQEGLTGNDFGKKDTAAKNAEPKNS